MVTTEVMDIVITDVYILQSIHVSKLHVALSKYIVATCQYSLIKLRSVEFCLTVKWRK